MTDQRTHTESFYQVFVTRGNSTFAYSADEYETYTAAVEEARRLFGLGEPHCGIYRFTRTVTREHVVGLRPDTIDAKGGAMS